MSSHTITVAPEEIIEVERVGGDLQIEGWDSAEVQAAGDQVRIEKRSGAVAISCGGDLKLTIPRAAHLSAGMIGGDARLEGLSGNMELGVIGGDAVLLNLSGPVQLNGMVGGDTRMENVSNISMRPGNASAGFDAGDRAGRRVDQAVQRAEEKIKRAHEKIRRAEERAGRRPHVLFGLHTSSRPAAEPVADPVSDEERMTILRMLQEKKITSEEADKLFAALEGNG